MNDLQFLHSSIDGQNHKENPIPLIYLIEDDQLLGQTIGRYLQKVYQVEVQYFHCPEEFLQNEIENSNAKRPFALITDVSFENKGLDGLLLIDKINQKNHSFFSVVMTGFASIESAILATKKGVYHYLTKPFDLEILGNLIEKAFAEKLGITLRGLNKVTKASERGPKLKLESPTENDIFCGMIGRSQVMREVFNRIAKVAQSDSTVLIHGPSGTGKELVAKALHELSPRKSNPMVSVNCGAIPAELLESELFGHVKGSFTGAISDRSGRFEMADHGSIFLDEIGDMPLLLQVKILRVLQNREIEKVGGNHSTAINVRIITATHRHLESLVKRGDFREDLYYRLNVIPIIIPGLKERKEDIPLLMNYFLSRYTSADGRNSLEFDDDAFSLLMAYDWPGNVRELENLIERLVILKGGSIIKPQDLPLKIFEAVNEKKSKGDYEFSLPDNGIDLKETLNEIENSLILQALQKTEGNKNQASKLLKMNRTTLIEKLKKKGLIDLFPSH